MDPLKPFGSLVRTAWARSVSKSRQGEKTTPGSPASGDPNNIAIATSPPPASLHARLRARMPNYASEWDTEIAREVFVESVLIEQFGDGLANDHNFPGMVTRICTQLAADPALITQLDRLLRNAVRST